MLITIGAGVALVILKPVVWFIDGNNMTLIGVMLILTGAMFFQDSYIVYSTMINIIEQNKQKNVDTANGS